MRRFTDTLAYWAIWLSGATIASVWAEVPAWVQEHPTAAAVVAIIVGGVAMGYLDNRATRSEQKYARHMLKAMDRLDAEKGSKEGRDV